MNACLFQSFDFSKEYGRILRQAEEEARIMKAEHRKPRSFQESSKAHKTVSSMIKQRDEPKKASKKKEGKAKGMVYAMEGFLGCLSLLDERGLGSTDNNHQKFHFTIFPVS